MEFELFVKNIVVLEIDFIVRTFFFIQMRLFLIRLTK